LPQGTTLLANYWRVVRDEKERIGSFDHRQNYGRPAPLDAIAELHRELQGKTVTEAQLGKETGDLLFQFTENIKPPIFASTGYEVWEISFPDGTGKYSN
jgi:hypothetical protein